MTPLYRFFHRLGHVLAPLMTRTRDVRGLENIPLAGPAIFISNHISYWDPTSLVTYVPRHIYFMSKAEMFRYPLLGWLFRAMRVFPVERGEADLDAIRHALAILRRGDPIALYPHGSRAPLAPGEIRRPKPGILLIAGKSGAPIVPVALAGLETLFIGRFPWIGRPSVSVTFGQPFKLEELQARPELAEDRDKLLDAVMAKVTDLLPAKDGTRVR